MYTHNKIKKRGGGGDESGNRQKNKTNKKSDKVYNPGRGWKALVGQTAVQPGFSGGSNKVLLFHGALTRYVAHLLAVVALRLLVTFRAVTSQVVTLSAPGEGKKQKP